MSKKYMVISDDLVIGEYFDDEGKEEGLKFLDSLQKLSQGSINLMYEVKIIKEIK